MKYDQAFLSKCLNERSNFRRTTLMRKSYKVLSMTRFDVVDRLESSFGYDGNKARDLAANFNEDRMEHMAGKIEASLCDGIGFWEALDDYISCYLNIKRVK